MKAEGLHVVCEQFGLGTFEQLDARELSIIEQSFKSRWNELINLFNEHQEQLYQVCRRYSKAEDQNNHSPAYDFYSQSAKRMMMDFKTSVQADEAWSHFQKETIENW